MIATIRSCRSPVPWRSPKTLSPMNRRFPPQLRELRESRPSACSSFAGDLVHSLQSPLSARGSCLIVNGHHHQAQPTPGEASRLQRAAAPTAPGSDCETHRSSSLHGICNTGQPRIVLRPHTAYAPERRILITEAREHDRQDPGPGRGARARSSGCRQVDAARNGTAATRDTGPLPAGRHGIAVNSDSVL